MIRPEPRVLEKKNLPEMVMTATRGPDAQVNYRAKDYGASVIRYWIKGWHYGDLSALPFVVQFPEERGHYNRHLIEAAYFMGLQVVTLEPNEQPPAAPWDTEESDYHRWASLWVMAFIGEDKWVGMKARWEREEAVQTAARSGVGGNVTGEGPDPDVPGSGEDDPIVF